MKYDFFICNLENKIFLQTNYHLAIIDYKEDKMSKYKYSFLTSNAKKAEDFKYYGFGVKEFAIELNEVKCPHTDVIALYKAKDTGLNNIIVEDTGLFVQNSPFCGTEIKYVYEHIKNDTSYNGRSADWTVAICLKTETDFLVSIGMTRGVLRYPAFEHGYHFESIFAVGKLEEEKRFCDLTVADRLIFSPRYKALEKLKYALENNDFSKLLRVSEASLPDWKGDYQEESSPKKKIKP